MKHIVAIEATESVTPLLNESQARNAYGVYEMVGPSCDESDIAIFTDSGEAFYVNRMTQFPILRSLHRIIREGDTRIKYRKVNIKISVTFSN
jgi:hypothetical protein